MLHLIFTVSKGWVTVTAPHAAMPPAMKALGCNVLAKAPIVYDYIAKTYPVVVDIENQAQSLRSPVNSLTIRCLLVFEPFFMLLLKECHHPSRIKIRPDKSDGAQEINSSSGRNCLVSLPCVLWCYFGFRGDHPIDLACKIRDHTLEATSWDYGFHRKHALTSADGGHHHDVLPYTRYVYGRTSIL